MQQILLAGGTPVFSPLDISGLDLWLKADAITGLSNNDPITTWTNLGVLSGNDMVGVTTGRPLWITNQINGLPIARFDGVNDAMQLVSNVAIRAAHTILFVCKSASTTQNSYFLNFDVANVKAVLSGFTDGQWKWFTTTQIGTISTTLFQVISTQIGSSDLNRWTLGGINPSWWAGDLAELLVYDSVISAPNLALVQAYLTSKYAL